ncbi:hypothetical protein PIB30_106262, partial [Stylosanthes scabra]|nr:hypothetical protein [Stylosanthes scabra]
MCGRQASSQRSQPTHASELPHAHAPKQGICVEEEFKPSLSYEDPRIGVDVHAYAWKMQQHYQGTASPTHMRGALRIGVETEQNRAE